MRLMKFGSPARGMQLFIAGSAALLLSLGLAAGTAASNDIRYDHGDSYDELAGGPGADEKVLGPQ